MDNTEYILENFRLVNGKIERKVPDGWMDTSGYVDKKRIRVNGVMMQREKIKQILSDNCEPLEEEVEKFTVKQAKALQRAQDTNRIERALIRKEIRRENRAEELFEQLMELVPEAQVNKSVNSVGIDAEGGTLIIGLSDVHIGMTVAMPNNVVNTKILSKRLYAYAAAAVKMGLRLNVKRCIFALTGDITTSKRRTGEAAAIEYGRAHAVVNAFELVSGMINFVSSYIKVTNVISVLGNEPRIDEDLELTHKCFYENFDWVLDRMLMAHYNGSIKFSNFTNPVEKLITVDGVNILLTHGLVKPRDTPDKQFNYYKTKYPEMNYMLCGHIHSELVALGYSRSSGLPGANEYSTYSLGIPSSKPGQTFHLVQDGRVFSFPIDLTETSEYFFPFTEPPKSADIAIVREEV